MNKEQIEVEIQNALRAAYRTGQVYWQQADSEYVSQNKKSEKTAENFADFVTEKSAAIAALAERATALAAAGEIDVEQLQARLDALLDYPEGSVGAELEAQCFYSWREKHVNRPGWDDTDLFIYRKGLADGKRAATQAQAEPVASIHIVGGEKRINESYAAIQDLEDGTMLYAGAAPTTSTADAKDAARAAALEEAALICEEMTPGRHHLTDNDMGRNSALYDAAEKIRAAIATSADEVKS